jgi:diguanylate cyclase (GGDEF)-like protein
MAEQRMEERVGDLCRRLQVLRGRYLERLPQRLAQIEELVTRLREQGLDADSLQALRRLAHGLRGSAATFELPALSMAAAEMEQRLDLSDGSLLAPDSLDSSLQRLRDAARLPEPAAQFEQQLLTSLSEISATAPRPLFLLDDASVSLRGLAWQVGHYGYEVKSFADVPSLRQALAQAGAPAAVVIAESFEPSHPAQLEAAALVRRDHAALPIVFVSQRDDLPARLAALRAGGTAFFVQPVEVSALVDALDEQARAAMKPLHRLLLVADDAALAERHLPALEQQRMLVHRVAEPSLLLAAMGTFRPDLILIDLSLSGADGFELASAIRQKEAPDGVPIVFLAGERSPPEVERLRGETVLSRSLPPADLASTLGALADRLAGMRHRFGRDPFTGLESHHGALQQLEVAVAQAQRQSVDVAVALVDIDQLKRVNDRIGHQAGDELLRCLARMLTRRLRRSDTIGRYGGDEFLLVLPGSSGQRAAFVLEAIRRDFAELSRTVRNVEVSCSFSGGVVALRQRQDPLALVYAAEQAMHEAKRGGGNKVVFREEAPCETVH